MTHRIDFKRGFLAALTAVAVALALVLVAGGLPASATHVAPVWHDGNVNCEVVSGTTEILRLENSGLANGTYSADGGGSITIAKLTEKTFDWSSSGVLVSAVFLKAGNGGWLYDYLPGGETADTRLDSGDHAISHITFCGGGLSTTTTTVPAPTTTTVPAPTTTTVPAPTTTTVPAPTTTNTVLGTSIVTTTTVVVSPTDETLPFTGADSGPQAALALVLVAGGALALVGARSFRAETDE